ILLGLHFASQYRCRTVSWRRFVKTLRAVVPVHFDVPLHRHHRYAECLHDLLRLHRPVHDHLTRAHSETPYVLFVMLKYRQVSIDVTNPTILDLDGDAIVDLRYSGG